MSEVSGKTDSFVQALLDQVPVYDKLILLDLTPTDSWVLHLVDGPFESSENVLERAYRKTLESVRKISETATGGIFLPTKFSPIQSELEHTLDRFNEVWPDVKEKWK